ncbi:MAG: UbiA family prenyltransferase [Flavisolibacter sp.]|nr:UbiA family prenyltransferase [Flavisolibacter sp.]
MPAVKNYLSLIKFSHTIFAMPFAMIGFFLAWRIWQTQTLDMGNWQARIYSTAINTSAAPASTKELVFRFVMVVFCMIFARSAAMAFNRYLDRKYDALNPRTAIREIPKGIIQPRYALIFTIVSCFLFMVSSYMINHLCFILSPVALAIVLGYSYTKRFTPLCHLILGLGLSLAPIGAYLAVTGKFHLIPVLFSLAVLFWVSGFDIIYALQDEEFDRSQKLYSIPSSVGTEKALRISELLHLLSASMVILAGRMGGFGWIYWIGVLVFGACLVYQHSIVKPNDLRKVNIAFMTTNGVASVVFAIFVIADLVFNSNHSVTNI